MRRGFQIIVFLRSFATGIMAPVLTLALLAHGASISTISLLMGAYSFTVIAAEFPSGVFADLCGRKKAFLLSALLALFSYGLLLVSKTLPYLFVAMIIHGLSRAFSSGSIDALAIDNAVANGSALVKVTGRLAILESAGLAAGALAGGFLSGLGALYEGNLIANLAIYALLFVLAVCRVREQPRVQDENGNAGVRRLGLHVKGSLYFVAQKGMVRMLFVFSFVTGFALISIETYWQPALNALSPASWLLGAVSFAGFFCVILGSKAIERALIKRPDGGVALMLGLKALFGICLVLLAYQFRAHFFTAMYILAYLFQGGGSVAESTLLNRAAPASQRASILSLFSFVLQVGALFASLISYVVSAQTNFRNIWLISGALPLLGAAAFALIYAKQRSRATAQKEPGQPSENQEKGIQQA